MTEEPGAVGDIATGGLIARAAEPNAGDGAAPDADGHTQESACLNCGTFLAGSHCHACGQRARVHRTLRAFGHDLLHGVLHFEGKTWRTLPLLAWKPGRLTREYIDGKRASYVSPIALFLFVVFLSFAVFNVLGAGDTPMNAQAGIEAANAAYRQNATSLEALEREQAALPPGESARRTRLARQIDELEGDQQGLRMVVGNVGAEVTDGLEEGFAENPLPEGNPFTRAIEDIRENPQLAIYKAQTNAYKFSWALIPLSVPFVWLLFPFSRRFGAYDHTVFATYSITFMVALAALVSLLFYAGWGGVGGLLLLYAPFHMYRQLRGTYALGRFGAGWRMIALSLFAWIAIALFASMIGILAA